MSTLTARKRLHNPRKFAIRDARTKVYRALYGDVPRPTIHTHDNGSPETNPFRELPQGWEYQHIKSVFENLATKTVGDKVVSNDLFPEQTYLMLLRRLDTLRKVKH